MGDREFLYADEQGVERIGAVGAVLELVFFRFSQFLAPFILATVIDSCGANRQEEVAVIILVDEHEVVRLTDEHTVDEQLLLDVRHLSADALVNDIPPVPLQDGNNRSMEVVVVQRIVIADERRVIVEDYLFLYDIAVVIDEVFDDLRQFSFILHIKRLDYTALIVVTDLSDDEPVDVCVSVEGDDEWQRHVDVGIHPAVFLLQAFEVELEVVEVRDVRCGI